jgi:hypothetical protein
VSPPPAPPAIGAPIVFGNPLPAVPFAASSRVLGLRRHPVTQRRRLRRDQGLY